MREAQEQAEHQAATTFEIEADTEWLISICGVGEWASLRLSTRSGEICRPSWEKDSDYEWIEDGSYQPHAGTEMRIAPEDLSPATPHQGPRQ